MANFVSCIYDNGDFFKGSLSLASCCTTMEKLLHTQSSLMAKAYNQHIQAFNSIQFELVRGFQYIIDISKDWNM